MSFNKVIEFFDLNSKIRTRVAVAMTASAQPRLHWFPQYVALSAGIFVQPFLARYQMQGSWDFTGGWGRILFSCIVGFAVFSQVYKKVITDRLPLIVMLGPIFTAGLGWQSLLGAALKMAKP